MSPPAGPGHWPRPTPDRPGTPYLHIVFIPFHFAKTAANALTNAAIDPTAKIPEYKVCAVKIDC